LTEENLGVQKFVTESSLVLLRVFVVVVLLLLLLLLLLTHSEARGRVSFLFVFRCSGFLSQHCGGVFSFVGCFCNCGFDVLCLLCMVCTLSNGYGLQVTGSGHLFDCSPPLPPSVFFAILSLLFSPPGAHSSVFLYLLGVSFLLLLWVFHLACNSCSRNSRIRTTPICRRRKPICRTEDPSAEDKTHLQKTRLFSLGFCYPEELGNVGEEFGAPIVIFLLHYGTHWSKSGHLGGGGRQGGKQTG
jgi:hypothetical protein